MPSQAVVEAAPSPAPGRAAESSHASDSSCDPAAVRAWAREQGIEVGSRGRLPATLINAYRGSIDS